MSQLFDAGLDIVMDSGLPDILYTGLSTTPPNANGTNVTEPVGGGYARQSTPMDPATGGVRDNTNTVQFAPSGGDWDVCTHSVYYDAVTGGNPIGFDQLDSPRNMVDGSTMDFAAGAIDFTLT